MENVPFLVIASLLFGILAEAKEANDKKRSFEDFAKWSLLLLGFVALFVDI